MPIAAEHTRGQSRPGPRVPEESVREIGINQMTTQLRNMNSWQVHDVKGSMKEIEEAVRT